MMLSFPSSRMRWGKSASFAVLIGIASILASCAERDRGRCLESQVTTEYRPTEVFLGGAGYTHEYVASQEPVCSRWEYPEGRSQGR